MAGTSKHFVYSAGGGHIYLDHGILPRLKEAVAQQQVRMHPNWTFPRRVQAVEALNELVADKRLTWRQRILQLWNIGKMDNLHDRGATLVEVKVRPNGSRKSCPFRRAARDYRKFAPKNPTRVPVPPAPGVTMAWAEEAPPTPMLRLNHNFITGNAGGRNPVRTLAVSVDDYLEQLDRRRRGRNQNDD